MWLDHIKELFMEEKLIEINNLSKYFPGVVALKDVSMQILKNTVHCIVGENGAGKSTLIKILTGALRKSEGKILYKGKEYEPHTTKAAMNAGMSVLFQELNVVNQLTVRQNLTLGVEESRLGFIRKTDRAAQSYEVLKSMDPSIGLNDHVDDLSVAQKQVIEITKAITSDADVIVMDEPTASLSEEETERLFTIIKGLKKQNVTVIYISHRLSEIFQIGDYVTVFRDGQMIGTKSVSELSYCRDEVESCAELIKMMLGKVVVEHYVPSRIDYDSKVLVLKNVSNTKLQDIGFTLYKGEILGFYGLVGSGKTEIARAIYGLDESEGIIEIQGELVDVKNPRAAITRGISMVPEERRTEGLFTKLSIRENISIMNMKTVSRYGIASKKKERRLARKFIDKVRIVARDEEQKVALLSGGNQQKVVVSKCLNAESAVLLLDEPTRGIDVGAKDEIHNIIRELSGEGASIVVFSSELPEIINLCDRIILLYDGKMMSELKNGENIDTEQIMHIVTGGKGDKDEN
jgi:ABC-type sugar transport system ATPase subunit